MNNTNITEPIVPPMHSDPNFNEYHCPHCDRFLFKGNNTIAFLNKKNKLVSFVKSDDPASINFRLTAPYDWIVEVKSSSTENITSELKRNGEFVSITLSSQSIVPIEVEEVILRKKP